MTSWNGLLPPSIRSKNLSGVSSLPVRSMKVFLFSVTLSDVTHSFSSTMVSFRTCKSFAENTVSTTSASCMTADEARKIYMFVKLGKIGPTAICVPERNPAGLHRLLYSFYKQLNASVTFHFKFTLTFHSHRSVFLGIGPSFCNNLPLGIWVIVTRTS